MRLPFLNEKRAVKLGKSFSRYNSHDERSIISGGYEGRSVGELGREKLATCKPSAHPGYLDISPANNLVAVKKHGGQNCTSFTLDA